MRCGGGHLHNECPEKGNSNSTPSCCNCKLAEGEKPHPCNYRGCSHAKEEIQRRRAQREPKTTTGRVFSPTYSTRGLSFAAALRSNVEKPQHLQTCQVAAAPESTGVQERATGQSVLAPSLTSESLHMLSVNCGTANHGRVQWRCVRKGKKQRPSLLVIILMKQNGQ
jgi:hypothetical protein